ncbi:YbbR-like domain-containing protein [Haloimpatiens sp. FM7330]|uniref:CdaR family protein n=1 Tax=Haloimpatiens sp. FM7330 TaxID=3298610 RepID=UPI00362E38B4
MDKTRKKDLIIKICCLIAAFGLWLYISNVENPIKTTVIKNVKVSLVNKDVLSRLNLVEVPNQNYTVNITVKGAANEIYALKQNQFKVVADMNDFALKKGKIRIPIEIKQYPQNITIINPENLWIKVELDDLVEKNVPVKVKTVGETKEGFIGSETVVSPKNILVSGPERYVNSVSYAKVDIDLSNQSQNIEGTYFAKPVDKTDRVVEHVKVDPKYVKVKIPVYQTKTVSVHVDTNESRVKNIVVKSILIEPDKIKILGDPEIVKGISKIWTEKLDLSNITSGNIVEIPLKIPENVKIVNEISKVKVKVIFGEYIKKNISLNIKINNLSEEYEAVLKSDKVSLIVSGEKSEMDNLSEKNIECNVDLNLLKDGNYDVPVNIKLPTGIKMISSNPQKIKVTIKKKEVEETDANKNQ